MKTAALVLVVSSGCSFFMRSTLKEPCPSAIAPIIDTVALATIIASTIVYTGRTNVELKQAATVTGGALLALPYGIAAGYGWSRVGRCR